MFGGGPRALYIYNDLEHTGQGDGRDNTINYDSCDDWSNGGSVLAHFPAGVVAFVPFGFWRGAETRGDHASRRAPLEVIFVTWPALLSVAAQDELSALLATTGIQGAWAAPLGPREAAGPPATIQVDALAADRAAFALSW